MQDKIWDVLLKEEEIGWRSILYDLVKSEKMNPWDINITLLTQKYIQVVKELPEHDLKVSGKIILAAALLLKMKCSHLIDNDISRFDDLMNPHDELDDIDEEFLFTYVSLCAMNPSKLMSNNFAKSLSKASEINPKRYCDLFKGDKFSFQVFDNPFVKEHFCEACKQ